MRHVLASGASDTRMDRLTSEAHYCGFPNTSIEGGVSRQRDGGSAEIYAQYVCAHVIQAQKAVDTRARRKRMREHGEAASLMSHCLDAVHADTGHVLLSAAGGNTNSARRRRRVVSDDFKWRNVQQCPGSPGVHGQTQHDASPRAEQLGSNDNETLAGIERIRHKMIAVSSGIRPVYMTADRMGRSEIAFRYTSSRSLLW